MEQSEYVELYEADDGGWRWRRKAANGRTLSDSGESFDDKDYALQEARDNNRGQDGEPLEVRDLEITGD